MWAAIFRVITAKVHKSHFIPEPQATRVFHKFDLFVGTWILHAGLCWRKQREKIVFLCTLSKHVSKSLNADGKLRNVVNCKNMRPGWVCLSLCVSIAAGKGLLHRMATNENTTSWQDETIQAGAKWFS